MINNVRSALASLELTEEELRTILERAETRALPKDAIVVKNGCRSDSLYILLEGRAKASVIDSFGYETVTSYYGTGEYFGGMGFDEAPLSASIMTVEPSRFLVLPKRDFQAFLPKNHLFAARVLEKLVREAEENAHELSEAVQHKTAISEILRALSASPTNAQPLLEAVAQNAARLCDVTDALILQVEGEELRLVAKYGPSQFWPIGDSRRINRNWITGRSVIDRTPIHVPDLLAVEAEFPQGAADAKRYGYRTCFAAPLMREGSAIGAILIRRIEVRPLTDKQIGLLMAFADQAAIAIENVRLFNEIREKSRKVKEQAKDLSEALHQKTAISEILRALSNSPTNVQSLLEAVAENAARLCDMTDASIFQVEGEELRLVAKYGPSQVWPIGTKRRITRNWVTGRAVVDRTPIHVHDLQAAEDEFPLGAADARQMGHRTVLVAPLMREGSAIGAILIRRFEVRPLTDKQIALLMPFADQAAIAIHNVRLFNEIQEKNRKVEEQAKELSEWNATLETRVAEQVTQLERLAKLEHELYLASEIQKSMLPRSIPRLEGYEFGARMIPAKSVGGDFFDFIPLGSGSLAIAVGDVSDKGVPAALFMAMVRSLLRAEAHPSLPPKEVLQRVNRHLMDMNDRDMFVTVLFGILNRSTQQFSYARAGHEPPIFLDGKGSITRMPTTNGQALGISETIAFDEQTIELSKSSLMLLYTDGIPDAANRQSERFGLDKITRTMSRMAQSSAQTACDELINAINEHQRDCLQDDDMTVIAVRAL